MTHWDEGNPSWKVITKEIGFALQNWVIAILYITIKSETCFPHP